MMNRREVVTMLHQSAQAVVVFLHGGPGMDHSYFVDYVNPLKKIASIVMYRQGHTGAMSMDELVAEYKKVIDPVAQGRKVVLMGHSWGAMLALHLVHKFGPDQFHGLVLVSPAYDLEWKNALRSREGARIAEAHGKVMKSLEDSGLTEQSDEYYRRLSLEVVDMYFTPQHRDEGLRILNGISYDHKLQAAIIPYLHNNDHLPTIGEMKSKALILTGAKDRITDLIYVSRIWERFPDIKRSVFGEASHFPFVEDPRGFNVEVARFIESLEETKPGQKKS